VTRASALLALLFALFATPVMAQPEVRRERVYLAELSMVLEGARRLILWAETYPSDTDFAKFAHPLAERYVEMAGRMTPPGKLVVVHPHLLIVVENVERALDAAGAGDLSSFRQRMRIVREELSNLDGVLKQLKVRLPELAR
jgi:hypothetical protein